MQRLTRHGDVSARLIALGSRPGPGGHLGRVETAGRIERGRGAPVRRLRRYDRHVLTFVFEGSGHYLDAGHDVALPAGSLVHVFPGHPHWYGADAGGWSEVFLIFDGPVFATALATGLLDVAVPVRSLAPLTHWRDRVDAFRTRRPPLTSAAADDEVCDVLRLLVDVASRDSGPGGSAAASRSGWLEHSRALLGSDLPQQLDLTAVAAAVGLGYETWRKRFTAEAGHPPATYRRQRRIEAASELLRRTSLTNHEIAAAVGFSDEHHLARQFRAATGMSTTAYRRSSG